MIEEFRHMVIIDPTRDKHIALERALTTSMVRNLQPEIRLFIAVNDETTDLRAENDNLYRDQAWLEELTAPLTEAGAKYSLELCWSDDWQAAALHSAKKFRPSHIFMPDYQQDKRGRHYSNKQWALLRRSKVPVTIVRPDQGGPRKKLLAAVNFQKDNNSKYAELNRKIVEEGMDIARQYGAEFYVVNAYSNSMDYPDREQIMRRTGLDTHHVHVEEGDPADVIADYAQKIGADAVLIGTLARSGALAIMRGNTSEKVLSRVQQDVITYS